MTPGRLFVVGLGPGDPRLLAPQALAALTAAQVVVGYATYLDLLPPGLLDGKEVVRGRMMGEVERCTQAVEAAASGRDTVVVSSGDAGVYGMAGLVLEILEARGLLDSVPWEVVPGIPALCAAAALLGAPLMHDFAVISLSDLLTPRELILRRVEAAAAADFVIVLYNPRSKRRRDILSEALAAVARHRAPQTPLGLVRNAWREGQETAVFALAGFDPARVDMLSILVIGNETTRVIATAQPGGGRQIMLTPRGYGKKYEIG
ncbi:precorrin-3B C17-methyltransferase [Desulfovibrio sp. X2]|uniref:precorrin-3B C(17)-methyltransferase n=1 Tax=Desulfovibrio sp. X2 TaxID=941449 RepID=UPI000358A972|nr:precorrin-3B C(17)-methyltransferase [Desulfovibrio sp. X2]EPR44738.1 precorrin-3B C17-methyltransferase [Desulfovibrio sp. X2]